MKAIVNNNSVGSWLEPYIGTILKIIKKGKRITWFEMNYGKTVKCKANSSFFSYQTETK